jgi:hypothetical protein
LSAALTLAITSTAFGAERLDQVRVELGPARFLATLTARGRPCVASYAATTSARITNRAVT